MKQNIKETILNVIIFTVAIVLSWGGLLYATNDPNHFRIIGVIASFVGILRRIRAVFLGRNSV